MMKRILVVGEFGIDKFVYGNIERLNPEAPTPILIPTDINENWGMAGNVYKNIKSLKEFEVIFLGNIDPAIKTRFVDKKSNYILLRTDEHDNISRIEDIDESFIRSFDAVVISDYNKGFLLEEDIIKICNLSKLSFMDTKKPLGDWCKCVDWIKINEKEFQNPRHQENFSSILKESLIVTLGGDGALYKGIKYKTQKTSVMDVVGAGDTFISAFAYYILKDKGTQESIEFANKCASEAVKRRGVTLLSDVLNK